MWNHTKTKGIVKKQQRLILTAGHPGRKRAEVTSDEDSVNNDACSVSSSQSDNRSMADDVNDNEVEELAQQEAFEEKLKEAIDRWSNTKKRERQNNLLQWNWKNLCYQIRSRLYRRQKIDHHRFCGAGPKKGSQRRTVNSSKIEYFTLHSIGSIRKR